MSAKAGVVLLWSARDPWFRVFPIDRDVALGRGLIETGDATMAERHAQIRDVRDRLLLSRLTDRNPLRVDGDELLFPRFFHPPCLIRTGRTLWAVIADVRPLEPAAWQAEVDAGWAEESCLSIFAPRPLGFTIARDLACRRGKFVRFDALTMHGQLESRIEPDMRTLVLEHPASLREPDLSVLSTWLETDLAVATVARSADELARLPEALTRRLMVKELVVPGLPYDDLPHQLWLAATARGVTLHVSVVEAALLFAARANDEWLALGWLAETLATIGDTGEPLRLEHCVPLPPV